MTLAPDPVLLDVSPEGVGVVTLNRPEKHNAVDELMIAGLSETFETLKGADHVRIVFLRGAGESFCAGADIDWSVRGGARDLADNEADAMTVARTLKQLRELPQITVAQIKGTARGEGVGLVAACDIAVAFKDASFCFPEVRFGLTPATIAPFVVAAIGNRWAKALFATGDSFDAGRAEKVGLVHYLVESEVEMEALAERLSDLAMAAAPGAVTAAKALVDYVGAHKIDDVLARETSGRTAQRRVSAEGKEGLAALLARRKPAWNP